MNLQASLMLVLAEILMAVSGLVLLLIAGWGGEKSSRLVSILAVAALVGAAALTVPQLTSDGLGASAFDGQIRADAFAGFSKILAILAAIVTLIVAPSFFQRAGKMRPEFPVLVVFSVLGMAIMVSARDLLAFYIGLELNSLAAYVLASFLRDDERSVEAGVKYFVLGALASGILLFGMSLLYGFAGGTSFDAIRLVGLDGASTGYVFGLTFVLVGLAFKISAVPFHMWTPDVYEGAPTPVTGFFATAPKMAAVAILARITMEAFGSQLPAWQPIIITAALLSILWGAFGAIGQTNIKRLLAYSSINNVGFLLIGLAAGTMAGVSAMLVYLAIYVAMVAGSFVAVQMLTDADGNGVEDLDAIKGLSTTRPMIALALAAMMFSLAGIPPLFGFWGKFVVFQAAVQANLIVLAAIGIAASVVGAFYYLKIVKLMYFDEPANVVTGKSDTSHGAILAICALIVSPLGYLLTIPLGDLADSAAAALLSVG
ncbi:NADH-quinone oxidoreductase subunit NuoN [Pseudoblastomonas halimionae]|uniref:NADH-quinone oxidoreductase subunit N n=1 Tax=Alteriqipengyuania halimionae TaxID=1926630 RepID=A0A6I4U0P1_9SPHN|nr:NADH-quinone oxidoreductase subunit NuoN [Alteriqipengyuania halimionae]MXP09448.1 NADH-quinone oxidoreductase subunit NuoN [Alteriqipengyuania halimionae]